MGLPILPSILPVRDCFQRLRIHKDSSRDSGHLGRQQTETPRCEFRAPGCPLPNPWVVVAIWG